jgi:hypothetical protein
MMIRCGELRNEDLMHFILECPAYDHIRDKYRLIFNSPAGAGAATCMRFVFESESQTALARCIAAMDTYRRHILGKGVLYGVRPILQPEGYIAQLVYPACLRGVEARMGVSQDLMPMASGGTMYIIVAAWVIAAVLVIVCVILHWLCTLGSCFFQRVVHV